MISTISRIIAVFGITLSILVALPLQTIAAVDCSQSNLSTHDAIQCGATSANGGASKTPDANSLIKRGINLFSAIIGIVAVLMIMLGGFRYITSGGSSEKVTTAKNTILYALIGLVIVALAQAIARFVLTKAST